MGGKEKGGWKEGREEGRKGGRKEGGKEEERVGGKEEAKTVSHIRSVHYCGGSADGARQALAWLDLAA